MVEYQPVSLGWSTKYLTNPGVLVCPLGSHFSLIGRTEAQMGDQLIQPVNELEEEPFLLKYQNVGNQQYGTLFEPYTFG